MDAWTIYWILQLDSINSAFGTIALISGIASSSAFVFSGIVWLNQEEQAAKIIRKFSYRAAWIFAITIASGALIPSTKTAAAMVVIPAIANNETIRNEAADLYKLAKDALRDAVTDGEPKRAD